MDSWAGLGGATSHRVDPSTHTQVASLSACPAVSVRAVLGFSPLGLASLWLNLNLLSVSHRARLYRETRRILGPFFFLNLLLLFFPP